MKQKPAAYDVSKHEKEDSFGMAYPEVEACICWVSKNNMAFNVNKPNNRPAMYVLLEIDNQEFKRVKEHRKIKSLIEEWQKESKKKVAPKFKKKLAGLSKRA